jgi:chromate transporter
MLVAGTAFIAPGALASLVLAWTYARYGALPAAAELAAGLRPALAVVVAHAAFGMATTALAAWPARLAFGAALAMGVAGAHEIAALVAAGLVALASSRWLRPPPGRDSDRSHVAALQSSDDASATSQPATSQSPAVEAGPRPRLAGWLALAMTSGGAATAKASALGVFVAFAKVGSLVFGSGYVLFAFLRAELVARRGWATEAVVADAIAAGQLTPGPVFSAATFLGHHLAGWQGALAATLGVFAPAFVFVSASGPLVARIRGSSAASAALGGVAAGSLALVALVVTELARTAIAGPRFLAISAVATIAMARGWAGPTTVLVGGAAASLGAYAFGLGGASW